MSESAPRNKPRNTTGDAGRNAGRNLDAASGLPLHPVARQAYLAALDDGWAEPGRLYGAGRRARLLLDAAREAAADVLGARPDELSFAGNGTQALHAAVLGTLGGAPYPGGVLVHSAVEHSAVLQAGRVAGHGTVTVPVDRVGRVDPDEFSRLTADRRVAAAALQAANHEVGTRQPVDEVDVAVPLVVDVTQTLSRAPLPTRWDVLAADARTWGGPSVGLLAVRTGVRWHPTWPEDDRGDADRRRLPGPPDIPSVVAAAAALRAVDAERDAEAARQHALVERIRSEVVRRVPDVEVLGDPTGRLPHIVTFSCLYVDGEALLTALDRHGFAVSSGSSCTSSTLEPSHVLVAMGALTSGNVRVSLHAGTTDADVDTFLDVLPGVVAEVRAELGADGL